MRIEHRVAALCSPLAACKRKLAELRTQPARRGLRRGNCADNSTQRGPVPQKQIASPYEGNAWAHFRRRAAFCWYNCSGCHAHGGGGYRPASHEQAAGLWQRA